MDSVLDKATPADVSLDPFPHLVVHEALDDGLYNRLASGFPRPEQMKRLSSEGKFSHEALKILADTGLDPAWHAFVERHVSGTFYQQVVALFGDLIRNLHPDLENRLGKRLEELGTAVRFAEGRRDIALEAQCILSEGTSSPGRIIGPHVDRPVALYAGLYYFRMDGDDSTGGDLELYRFKPGGRAYKKATREIPDDLVQKVKVIPYAKNTLVLFPHSADSVHGVSTRSTTTFPRRHVNFVGELPIAVYDLGQYPALESGAQS